MTIPTAREVAAAKGLATLGKRGRMPKAAMDYLATLREGIDYIAPKKVTPSEEAEAKRAERERVKAEKAAAANADEAAKREAKAEAARVAAAEKAQKKADTRPATPSGPRARVASNLTTARVEGQPTKAYTIVYPTAEGKVKGHAAFLWAPQTCSEGHRIGYCRCSEPKAPMLKGEGSLHGGGVLMWSKPASL